MFNKIAKNYDLMNCIMSFGNHKKWEQEIVQALLYEKLSLRAAGEKLNIPKTTLARRRDEIWKKIENQLLILYKTIKLISL